MSSSTIFIAGATGTVGAALVDALVEQGYPVRAGTRDPEAQSEREGVEWALFDYDSPSTFQPALGQSRRVFLLSPTGHANAHKLMHGFIDFLGRHEQELAAVVMMTAKGVDADDTIPLRAAELELLATDLPVTLIRPTWFMQNFASMWREGIVERDEIALPADESKIAFVDARDIAQVAVAALTREGHAGKTYTLTGDESLSLGDVSRILSEATERSIGYRAISDDDFREQLSGQQVPAAYVDMLSGLFRGVREGWAEEATGDVERVLGRHPRRFAQYANDYSQTWQSR